MDIVEFAEQVLKYKLKPFQAAFISRMDELYKENPDEFIEYCRHRPVPRGSTKLDLFWFAQWVIGFRDLYENKEDK